MSYVPLFMGRRVYVMFMLPFMMNKDVYIVEACRNPADNVSACKDDVCGRTTTAWHSLEAAVLVCGSFAVHTALSSVRILPAPSRDRPCCRSNIARCFEPPISACTGFRHTWAPGGPLRTPKMCQNDIFTGKSSAFQ